MIQGQVPDNASWSEAFSLWELAQERLEMREPEGAIPLLEQARAAFDRLGDGLVAGMAGWRLGEVQLALGRIAEALPVLETALADLQAGGHARLVARVRLLLGMAELLEGRVRRATTHLEQASQACEWLELNHLAGQVWLERAVLARACGRELEAVRALRQARGRARACQAVALEARVCEFLGGLALEIGAVQEARACLRGAIDASGSILDYDGQGWGWLAIAELETRDAHPLGAWWAARQANRSFAQGREGRGKGKAEQLRRQHPLWRAIWAELTRAIRGLPRALPAARDE